MEPTLIESKIYEIRGQRVMLDKDLADLYAVETKNLNKAVKRNPDRFPPDFMFQLTEEEFNHLRFHFGTSSWGGSRYMPYAFTEQGVAMLSGILRSPIAVQVNINIMRAFVKVRQYAFSSPINQAELLQLKEQIKLILSRQSEMNLRLQLKTTKLDRIRVKGYLKYESDK